jgi:hypothetical protein
MTTLKKFAGQSLKDFDPALFRPDPAELARGTRAKLLTTPKVAAADIPGLDHPAVQGSIARHSNDAPAPQHEAFAQGGWTTWSHERRAYVWKGTHAERVAKRIAEYEASVRQCARFATKGDIL